MAIVFVSPKQRQKMFFLGITILFLLFLLAVGLFVFLAPPKKYEAESVFIKPDIQVNFDVLDSLEVKNRVIMGRIGREFNYVMKSLDGQELTGSLFAESLEKAKEILEESGLVLVSLEETEVGRENPFTPYYTVIIPLPQQK